MAEVQTLQLAGQASQFPALMTNLAKQVVQVAAAEQVVQLAGQASQVNGVII